MEELEETREEKQRTGKLAVNIYDLKRFRIGEFRLNDFPEKVFADTSEFVFEKTRKEGLVIDDRFVGIDGTLFVYPDDVYVDDPKVPDKIRQAFTGLKEGMSKFGGFFYKLLKRDKGLGGVFLKSEDWTSRIRTALDDEVTREVLRYIESNSGKVVDSKDFFKRVFIGEINREKYGDMIINSSDSPLIELTKRVCWINLEAGFNKGQNRYPSCTYEVGSFGYEKVE